MSSLRKELRIILDGIYSVVTTGLRTISTNHRSWERRGMSNVATLVVWLFNAFLLPFVLGKILVFLWEKLFPKQT